jgi:hypothetical protein
LTHETTLIFTPIPETIRVNSWRLADSQIKAGLCGSKISNAIALHDQDLRKVSYLTHAKIKQLIVILNPKS